MKKSLTILVVGALLGTMLIGCGAKDEGNVAGNAADGAMPTTKTGDAAAGTNAPAVDANAPAANAPAMDANAPAANAPAAEAKK